MIDALTALPEITWRGIRVPWSDFATDLKHAIVQHKYPNVAGAQLEAMGREPLTITGRASFIAGLLWRPYQKPLYPDGHRAFLKACADDSTGELVHPTWGRIRAKCESAKSSLSATVRGGEMVDVVFLEDATEINAVDTKISPMALAVDSADKLDAELRSLAIKNANLKIPPGADFGSMMRSIQSISDKASLLQKQVGGKIASVQYRLGAVRDSIDRLKSASVSNARKLVEKTQAAVYDVERTILVLGRTGTRTLPGDMTIAATCRWLVLKVADFIRLNPSLARKAIIPANTVVTTYIL